ncbi:cullin protein neddylation domain protein (macronuclear) [Tetrahymena thermophila SB210]|uniref:Cullin protein neddylation domain protein n=1 Tax=Tetrahymena thermophila (strain SB210) TaxID=312017 RepID=Q23F49_TETTS|nr:cullin protein neddylation domain protein [Tetrahymena thermophila SB210]EAR95304.2 cullin protein neddylation domain protein [Tetrahymena thermophila SB210]|eukprot:XP_001015549.2 cullin protein neddylation domain protein [Tetrahymena thermophila SB210]
MNHTVFHVQNSADIYQKKNNIKFELSIHSDKDIDMNLQYLEQEVSFQLRDCFFDPRNDKSGSISKNQIKKILFAYLRYQNDEKVIQFLSSVISSQWGGNLKSVVFKLAELNGIFPQKDIVIKSIQESISSVSSYSLKKISEEISLFFIDWFFEDQTSAFHFQVFEIYSQICKNINSADSLKNSTQTRQLSFKILSNMLTNLVLAQSKNYNQYIVQHIIQFITSKKQQIIEIFCNNFKSDLNSATFKQQIEVISHLNQLTESQFIFQDLINSTFNIAFDMLINLKDVHVILEYHKQSYEQISKNELLKQQYALGLRNSLENQNYQINLAFVIHQLIQNNDIQMFKNISSFLLANIDVIEKFEISYRHFLIKRLQLGEGENEANFFDILCKIIGSNKISHITQIVSDLKKEKDKMWVRDKNVSILLINKQNATFQQIINQFQRQNIPQISEIQKIITNIFTTLKQSMSKKQFLLTNDIIVKVQIQFSDKNYVVQLSLDQYSLLSQFQKKNQIKKDELKKVSSLNDEDFQLNLQSLINSSFNGQNLLLVKDDDIQFNLKFGNNNQEYDFSMECNVKYLIGHFHKSSQKENKKIAISFEENPGQKKYIIEAGIVKMAKQLMSFDKNVIFQKTLDYLRDKIQLDFTNFDTALEGLIKKQYIEDKGQNQYKYIP